MLTIIFAIITIAAAVSAAAVLFTAQLKAGRRLARQVREDYGLTVTTSAMANAITGGGTIVQIDQNRVLAYDSTSERMQLLQLTAA